MPSSSGHPLRPCLRRRPARSCGRCRSRHGTAGQSVSYSVAAADAWSSPVSTAWSLRRRWHGHRSQPSPTRTPPPARYAVSVTVDRRQRQRDRTSTGTTVVAAAAVPVVTPPVPTPKPALTGVKLTQEDHPRREVRREPAQHEAEAEPQHGRHREGRAQADQEGRRQGRQGRPFSKAAEKGGDGDQADLARWAARSCRRAPTRSPSRPRTPSAPARPRSVKLNDPRPDRARDRPTVDPAWLSEVVGSAPCRAGSSRHAYFQGLHRLLLEESRHGHGPDPPVVRRGAAGPRHRCSCRSGWRRFRPPLRLTWTSPITTLADGDPEPAGRRGCRRRPPATRRRCGCWTVTPSSSIKASTHPIGGTWSAPVDIATPGDIANDVDLATSSTSGLSVAVWSQSVGGAQRHPRCDQVCQGVPGRPRSRSARPTTRHPTHRWGSTRRAEVSSPGSTVTVPSR